MLVLKQMGVRDNSTIYIGSGVSCSIPTWERTVCRLLRGLSSSGQVLDGAIPRVHVPRQILKILRAADLGSDRPRMHEVAATRLAALRQQCPHHLQKALLETPQPAVQLSAVSK